MVRLSRKTGSGAGPPFSGAVLDFRARLQPLPPTAILSAAQLLQGGPHPVALRPKYSIISLIRNALSYHQDWQAAWRSPDPKPEYDVIIVGGGGHGLATAYYLAKEHGITNVAADAEGWVRRGNNRRNPTN